jgi:hypothetical protein
MSGVGTLDQSHCWLCIQRTIKTRALVLLQVRLAPLRPGFSSLADNASFQIRFEFIGIPIQFARQP